MFRAVAGMVRAWSEATRAATFPTSSSVAARLSMVRRTMRSKRAGQAPPEGLDRLEFNLEASQVVTRQGVTMAAEGT